MSTDLIGDNARQTIQIHNGNGKVAEWDEDGIFHVYGTATEAATAFVEAVRAMGAPFPHAPATRPEGEHA